MSAHFHTGIDAIIFVVIAALVGRKLVTVAAAKLAKQQGIVGDVGLALGAIAS